MTAAVSRFRAYCPECRSTVELGPDAFRLSLGRTSERSYYSFTCPSCEAPVRKRAGERIVEALTGAGVPAMRLHVVR